MADNAASPESAVKSAPGSAPEAKPATTVNTPLGENPGSAEGGKVVPYTRFKEVIDLKNGYENRIAELEGRLASQPSAPVAPTLDPILENEVRALMSKGLEREGATEVVLSMDRLTKARLEPVQKAKELDSWLGEFAQSHPDFREIEPEMTRQFAELSPVQQKRIAANPEGIEVMYYRAKAAVQSKGIADAKAVGATEAYKNMGLKGALSSTPGSVAPNGALTRESIRGMSREEFVKRSAEIRAAYEKGLIR